MIVVDLLHGNLKILDKKQTQSLKIRFLPGGNLKSNRDDKTWHLGHFYGNSVLQKCYFLHHVKTMQFQQSIDDIVNVLKINSFLVYNS